ncbi:hypothetical protein NUW54_g2928 [Trametes sanguinea]|uniref:Uncharacterized protein n=1 Tax=Trametes sanguinea TaxID=158606 RepID=A0ACC1Q3F0_9APHY|nr:hypothetical protein NUW54_g2928 [Trametes sanguinea]
MSMLSRRSQTPTGSYFLRTGQTSREGKRSVSPSSTVPEAPRPQRYEDQSSLSVAGEATLSYEFLGHMEKRYDRLMADLSVVEGRLDEVSSMLESRR